MAKYRKPGSFVYVKDKELLKKSFSSFLPCQVFKVSDHSKSNSGTYVWVESNSQGLLPSACVKASEEQIKQYKKEKKAGLYLSSSNGYELNK